MKRAILPLGALFALSFGFGPGCAETHSHADCRNLCKDLSRCNYLPSPLGTGDDPQAQVDNCIARCELTTGRSADAVRECQTEVDFDAPKDDTACGKLRNCLVQAAGVPILGKGDVALLVTAGDGGPSCECPALPTPDADGGEGGMSGNPAPPSNPNANGGTGSVAPIPDEPSVDADTGVLAAWCDRLGFSSVVPFADTLGGQRHYGKETACKGALKFAVNGVPAGNLERAGLEFRASSADADGGAPR